MEQSMNGAVIGRIREGDVDAGCHILTGHGKYGNDVHGKETA